MDLGAALKNCPAAKRDLIAEMAQALNAKGIKLMCYFPAHVIGRYPKASSQEFSRMTTDIVREFGERYGDKVAGYWFDGFYQCFEKYPDFSFRDFFCASDFYFCHARSVGLITR